MKKLLMVAALAISATAFAQSNATVSGEIRMFEDNTKVGNGPSVNRMLSDKSKIVFGASEALGSGLTARVLLDTSIAANDPKSGNTQFGDRQSTIGLANSFGSIDFGRRKSTLNLMADSIDPFVNKYGSTFNVVHNLQTTRLSNGVFIDTASFGGLSGSYNYGQSNVAGVAGTTGVGATYKAFGGNVHYAYQGEKQTGAKTNLLGVGYEYLPTGTVLGYDHSNSNTAISSARTQGNSFTVTQPVWTRLAARGTYGQSKTDGVDDNTKALSLGLVYSLSKRTTIEAAYTNVNAPGIVADTRSFGAGLTHAF